MSSGDITLEFSVLRKTAANYDETQYLLWIPLSQQPILQLIPAIGNIIVFVQNTMFILRTNRLINIPRNERLHAWFLAILLLVLGFVPVVGLLLTKYLQVCTRYLAVGSKVLPTYGFKEKLGPKTARSETISAAIARFPIEEPDEESAVESLPDMWNDDSMSWMDELLCDSPADACRISLSNTVQSTRTRHTADARSSTGSFCEIDGPSSMHTLAAYSDESLHSKVEVSQLGAKPFRFLKNPESLHKSTKMAVNKPTNLVIRVPTRVTVLS
ncbi:hypothetical protein GGI12_003946 [Dipsacomyces acuminosporus]|nr:hypothetical protein GGI12_003946 [Dipsacomyces acuminosporus]